MVHNRPRAVTEYHPAWYHAKLGQSDAACPSGLCLQPKAHHDAMLSALCPVLGTKWLVDTSDSQASPNGNMVGKGSVVVI